MSLVLGIDPDLHVAGLALLDSDRVCPIIAVRTAKMPTAYKGSEAVRCMILALYNEINGLNNWFKGRLFDGLDVVVVEGQQKYAGERARPEDLINLAQVAGGAVACACRNAPSYIPKPREWKGQVPKGISQARILDDLKIPYELLGRDKGAIPRDPSTIPGGEHLTKKEWHAVVDAMGLALWGVKQIRLEERKARRLEALGEEV